MDVKSLLASVLGRKDEGPNIELAVKIVTDNNVETVNELFRLLTDKDKNIQSDTIKVIDEVGKRNAELLVSHISALISLLDSKNNRLVWGAMAAIDNATFAAPELVFSNLSKVLKTADAGTVITRDHAVGILIKLAQFDNYRADCLELLQEQMKQCPTNQLPMYAEQAIPVIIQPVKESFIKLLQSRLAEIEKDSKRLRVEKVINKLKKG